MTGSFDDLIPTQDGDRHRLDRKEEMPRPPLGIKTTRFAAPGPLNWGCRRWLQSPFPATTSARWFWYIPENTRAFALIYRDI